MPRRSKSFVWKFLPTFPHRKRRDFDATISDRFRGYECVYDDADCAIYFKPGTNTKRCIVSFTGIGHSLGGVDLQAPEFVHANKFASVFFVIDKNRTWGNRLNIEELSKLIVEKSEGQEITCIGNSMGGFLAVLFSKHLGAASVISIAPQWSVDKRVVPGEKRWKKYRKKIAHFVHADLAGSFDEVTRYLIIFGTGPKEDLHAQFFDKTSRCKMLRFADAGHDVASFLKGESVLYDVIETWMDGDDPSALLVERKIRLV